MTLNGPPRGTILSWRESKQLSGGQHAWALGFRGAFWVWVRMGCGIAWYPLAPFWVYFRCKYLNINHLELILASPGAGDLRHLLPNLSHCFVLTPQTTAYFSIAQLWILRERLGDTLMPKFPGWSRNHSLAKFLPGRSGIDTVSTTPKKEAGSILQNPITCLCATFPGIYQSRIQDRRCEFFNRVHKEYGLDSPIFSGDTDKPTSVHSFLYCVFCVSPDCSACAYQWIPRKGERMVKTRSQRGYFWPTAMSGNEQWNPQAHVGLPY